jgi:AcrR family transcriptional regulator
MLGNMKLDRRAKHREATRREILEAAWQVAREQGLAALTLRELAARVGMQAPSLYSHFGSKNAIYDAMFAQAWEAYRQAATEHVQSLPTSPRAALKSIAGHFFDFAVADLARHQIMNQRVLPGFHPTAESYAPAVAVLEELKAVLGRLGIRDADGVDLYTALVSGLVEQQLANDPGGDRWLRLLERTIDMYANEMNL